MYKSCSDLACTIVDSLRAGRLDHKWFIANVDFPDKEKCMKIIEQAKPKGCIVVAGHLGSFEFMPAAFYAHTLQESRVIARSFKNSYLNTWINSRRSESGVGVIERSGAMKKILASLKNGTHVGILFDQNVTRNLAVFVSWFGVPAATTKALGYAAVRLAVPVLVLNIARAENGRYRLELENLPLDTVLQQEELSFDEKVEKVTALATAEFEKYLLANPTGWFWMHRRWKTRPAENDPSIY